MREIKADDVGWRMLTRHIDGKADEREPEKKRKKRSQAISHRISHFIWHDLPVIGGLDIICRSPSSQNS